MKKARKLELVRKLIRNTTYIIQSNLGTMDRLNSDDITDIISLIMGNKTSITSLKEDE